jgi:hypothetical protein
MTEKPSETVETLMPRAAFPDAADQVGRCD